MSSVVNVVLVHGAWADGSCWSKEIPLLQAQRFHVSAAQIPLTSLKEDIAVTKRLLALQKGPTVLVGHSYGGAVISGAAVDSPNVKALAYIAAFGLLGVVVSSVGLIWKPRRLALLGLFLGIIVSLYLPTVFLPLIRGNYGLHWTAR